MQLNQNQINEQIERMQALAAESVAEDLMLFSWGKWARKEGANLSYPRCLLPFTAKGWGERDLSRIVVDIPEERAMKIDAAVARLPVKQRAVIVMIYKAWLPVRTLPARMSISRHVLDQYHQQALGMLWADLSK